MTTDEFFEHWCDTDLRQYIVVQAKRRNRLDNVREELIQEAWLAISCAPGSWDTESLKEVAYKAIYSGYWKERKETLLFHTMDEHRGGVSHKSPEQPQQDEIPYKDKRDWRL